jgi:hypothetical protein
MTGDLTDIASRLRSVLPSRWFADSAPVLDTLLNGIASGWEYMHRLLRYAQSQTRMATASGIWLDLAAQDFFGAHFCRTPGQSDDVFRLIVRRNILRSLGTRSALRSALTDLTGRQPIIFEPRNTSDTGGYGSVGTQGSILGGGIGYGTSGGWGNLDSPFQCFVTVFRPHANGVANVSGWGFFAGGYGLGSLEYADTDIAHGYISDAQILEVLTWVKPAGSVVWAKIAS